MLDATYELDAQSLLWQFPNQQNSDFEVQGIAVRGLSET